MNVSTYAFVLLAPYFSLSLTRTHTRTLFHSFTLLSLSQSPSISMLFILNISTCYTAYLLQWNHFSVDVLSTVRSRYVWSPTASCMWRRTAQSIPMMHKQHHNMEQEQSAHPFKEQYVHNVVWYVLCCVCVCANLYDMLWLVICSLLLSQSLVHTFQLQCAPISIGRGAMPNCENRKQRTEQNRQVTKENF